LIALNREEQVISSSAGSPASLLRMVTSSLFAFVLFTLWGAGVSQYVAKEISRSDRGILFSLVETLGWLLASFMGGFIAGYRAAGRGSIPGLLVGAYADLLLLGFLFLLGSETRGVDFEVLTRTARRHPVEFWPPLILMISILPATILGGRFGDVSYRNNSGLEDPTRHTLFGIPWWHWAWLLLFLPPIIVNDALFSGHLLVLGVMLAVLSSIHFRVFDVILGLATSIGLLVGFFGMLALWQGLSIRTNLTAGRRLVATILGIVLLFSVTVMWRIGSPMLQAAIKSILP
jgi:hypothetical protein